MSTSVSIDGIRRDRPRGAVPKQRVLIEFASDLLARADEAARAMNKNRTEFIRGAVERFLSDLEKQKFEQELAAGYIANAEMNLDLAKEFQNVDAEGL